MPIIRTYDFQDFKYDFEQYGRKKDFSKQALELIFEYLQECYCDTNWEMDCIAICCEFKEMACTDILQDYDVYVDDGMSNDELADQVREYLHDNTSLVGEYTNDNGETVFIFVAF